MSKPNLARDVLAQNPDYDAAAPVLDVRDLHVEFRTRHGKAYVVDGLSYQVDAGQTIAVVGESGCGKSITARAIMGILPERAVLTGGTARLHGIDLLTLDQSALRRIRGRRIAMIFQDALSSLNPVLPVGFQVAEVFRAHQHISRRAAHTRAVEMLDRVRISDAARRARDYPHQFSGGMRQRVMIAMALAVSPDVLIADEPTTALDVTVQAQIMELLAELRDEQQMSLILISHDMGVVADVADRVVVMYGGRVVEQANVTDLFATPAHPYTRALLDAIPRRGSRHTQLAVLQGIPPDPAAMPAGCAFRPRCRLASDNCLTRPPLYDVSADRASACHRWQEELTR